MLRCLVTRSTSNPFDFGEKCETSAALTLLDIVPEITSCITSEDFWSLPEPLGEQEYGLYGNLENGFPWLYIVENAYNLLHDPTAIYMRAILKLVVLKPSSCIFMALNEGYRKYFPEEKKELLGVVNKWDRCIPVLDQCVKELIKLIKLINYQIMIN
jgi:hypothetical protein